MDFHMKDKVVLVTGSGEGIGRQAIRMFVEEGAHVIVNDLIADKAEQVAADKTFGVESLSIIADVTQPEEVNKIEGAIRQGNQE
jgi:NAD(P)-dependent dehydrogenase (short-subunit alcohol dehydrogenase family)